MNQILNVSSSVDQQTLAALQVKLLRDSPPENGQVRQVSADYIALQVALKSGNAAEAESDFVRLQHDTQAAGPAGAAPQSSAATTQPTGGQSSTASPSTRLLDALA